MSSNTNKFNNLKKKKHPNYFHGNLFMAGREKKRKNDKISINLKWKITLLEKLIYFYSDSYYLIKFNFLN